MDSVYVIGSLILIGVVLAAVWLDRWSVPVILIALCAGILCGSDVLNLWYFDDINLTKQIANLALVFILFHGGFSTKKSDFKAVALPAGGLATWGVILTAATTFCVLRYLLRWPFEQSILLAVIISSTDAAAIFSILRRQSLPRKLSSITEIESGANDPMAVLLTVAVLGMLTSSHTAWPMTAVLLVWKVAAAPVAGWLLARGGLWLFNRLRPQDRGHYYVLSLGIILLTYGIAEALQTSGMLAVFVAGYTMGNRPFVHKQGVTNFSAALSTVANITMFVMLGLQVFPHQWNTIWLQGIIVFAVLTFIARPLAVVLGTIGMRLGWKDKVFIAWAGLRGSVPIVLATYPAAAGLAVGQDVFNMVFFAVILSIAVQGSTLGALARWLKLTCPMRPKPLFNLELVTMRESDFDLIVVDIPDVPGSTGQSIADLQLPPDAMITLITRGQLLIAPKGSTQLHGGDQVTVLAHASEEYKIRSILLDAVSAEPSPENAESPNKTLVEQSGQGQKRIQLQDALNAWGQSDFEAVLKKSIAALAGDALPLQQGLTAGSYALGDSIEAVILSTKEQLDAIEVKTQIFYTSRTPGCACAGDPTVESDQTEQCLVRIRIDKKTAEAAFQHLQD
jgi:cell volume regulation protein A